MLKTETELKAASVEELTQELRDADAHVQEMRAYMKLVHDELELKEVVASKVYGLKELSRPQRERLLLEMGPGVDTSAVGKP